MNNRIDWNVIEFYGWYNSPTQYYHKDAAVSDYFKYYGNTKQISSWCIPGRVLRYQMAVL